MQTNGNILVLSSHETRVSTIQTSNMAATARPAALFILAVLLLAPPRAAAAQSCPTVYGTLMPCLGYVESGGAVPQSAAC
jgi:hypothetical protein